MVVVVAVVRVCVMRVCVCVRECNGCLYYGMSLSKVPHHRCLQERLNVLFENIWKISRDVPALAGKAAQVTLTHSRIHSKP